MKIKQVEELVGITSKNIRFYEDQGLIIPERLENGYREYHEEDVKVLQKIKLFRKIGVPVEEIKNVFDGKSSLENCLEKQLLLLEKEKNNFSNMQNLTKMILSGSSDIKQLDVNSWLDEVEKMEKEGTNFVDTSKIDVHMKKKAGAWMGGLAIIIISVFMIALYVWLYLTEGMPMSMMCILIFIHVITIIGILAAIKMRLKEIDGGEEDEASKY